MKKMFLFGCTLAFSAASFAQLSIGLQGTGNLSSARIKMEKAFAFQKSMKAFPGGGVVVQYDFSRHVAIRSGISYLQQGVSLKATADEGTGMKVTLVNKLNYIQVPINLLFAVPVIGMRFFAGGGGFISYGISGNATSTLRYTMPDGSEFKSDEVAKAFKKEEEEGGAGLKKADYGMDALAGVQFRNGLFANVGYQLSLSNSVRGDGGGRYKNRGLQVSIGYFF